MQHSWDGIVYPITITIGEFYHGLMRAAAALLYILFRSSKIYVEG